MDSKTAKKFAATLIGKTVGGWRADESINNGKSAVVLKARKGRRIGALKVFDPELVEEQGAARQLGRIARELRLASHGHQHLVQVLDGGICPKTGYLHIVMAYVPWDNLATQAPKIPADRIATIISQVADAAKYLESRSIFHRDIKPENIAISADYSKAILLDLGVIRQAKDVALTDGTAGKHFLATTRYSSPSYLLRQEAEGDGSLLALTFYQLGGVLHDMIMGKPLFAEYSIPPGRLHFAIHNTVPLINRPDVNQRLCALARNCLLKDDQKRLAAVNWDDFSLKSLEADSRDKLKARVLKRLAVTHAPDETLYIRASEEILKDAASAVRSALRETASSDLFPPRIISENVEESEGISVRMSLAEDSAKQINRCVTIAVKMSVLESRSETVKFEWAACANGGRGGQPCLTPPSEWQHLYTGIIDSQLLKQHVEAAVFIAVDQVQSLFAPRATSPVFGVDGETPAWFASPMKGVK